MTDDPQENVERWQPTPIPQGDGRHDIGDDMRAAIVARLTEDWSRDPDLTPEKARQLAMWAAASVRSLFHELGSLREMAAADAHDETRRDIQALLTVHRQALQRAEKAEAALEATASRPPRTPDPFGGADAPVEGEDFAAPQEASQHSYLSTACHHELHARCRQSCKFCGKPCACSCHAAAVSAPKEEPPSDGVRILQAMNRLSGNAPVREETDSATKGRA